MEQARSDRIGGRQRLIEEIWEIITTTEGQPNFLDSLLQHLRLSLVALLLGLVIALGLALLLSNSPLGSLVAVNFSNVGRAVPSLAVLALLYSLPVVGGLSERPAIIALTLLAIPPILINATVGLREVERSVVESARGMGLSQAQVLSRIRLPIALPVIFAGIRTSAVQVVASATLATFIGGGGLGDLIVAGLALNSPAYLLAGAVPVALLAMLTEVGFAAVERFSTPRGLRLSRRVRPA